MNIGNNSDTGRAFSTIANLPTWSLQPMRMLTPVRNLLVGVGSGIFLSLLGVGLLSAGDPSPAETPRSAASPGSGISYRAERIPEKPLSIHVVKVDRSRADLVLATTLAKGTVFDLTPLSDQIKEMSAPALRPQVGINGDFYRTEQEPFAGDPLGFQVSQGELISSAHTNQPCFWLDGNGQPHIGVVETRFRAVFPNGKSVGFEINEERPRGTARLYTPRLGASTKSLGGREIILERQGTEEWLPVKPSHSYVGRVRAVREGGDTKLVPEIMILSLDLELAATLPAVKEGDTVRLSLATEPSTEGCELAIGGGPTLLRGGAMPPYKAKDERHPRAAFGWNETHWFFVEVDGRQSNLSIGMKLPELSEYLAKLGVKEAINLDGGGSATLWVFGQVVNSPCYGYERNTANGLVILKKDVTRREPD